MFLSWKCCLSCCNLFMAYFCCLVKYTVALDDVQHSLCLPSFLSLQPSDSCFTSIRKPNSKCVFSSLQRRVRLWTLSKELLVRWSLQASCFACCRPGKPGTYCRAQARLKFMVVLPHLPSTKNIGAGHPRVCF